MSIVGVMKYHWRRRGAISFFFVLMVTLIALISAIALIFNAREVSMALDAHGRIVEHVSYASVAFLDDLSRLINPSAFAILVTIFAVATLKHDRWFLVCCSVPRYQILLGTFLFLITLGLVLALVGGVLAPVLCRAVLWALGFPIRGGWSAGALLTGNNPALLSDMYVSICDMIFNAGLFALLGYVMLRWWKPILILFGAGIVLIILLVTMVRLETYVAQLVVRFADWAQWAAERLIPMLQDFFSKESQLTMAWKKLLASLVFMVFCYPVMRGMKVV